MALLLGVVGLYGVVAYSVGRRAKELGVRMALGARAERGLPARPRRDGAARRSSASRPASPARWPRAPRCRPLLFATPAADPWVLFAAAAIIAAAALLAGYLPARRAASVDPMIVLRAE